MFKVKKINNLEEAKKIWNVLSPNLSIYDNWDFRYAFYKHSPAPLHFFAGYEREELIGLLPLQYNEDEGGYLGFFAEEFMEDNRLFLKEGYDKYIPDFYAQVKEDVMVDDIAGEDEFTRGLPLEDYKYVLALGGLKGFSDHLVNSFTSKRRRQFLKVKSEMEKNRIEITQNDFSDIDLLFDLNIERHGDESYLSESHNREIFNELVKIFDVRLLTFKVNGVKAGASYSILYKGVYNYLSVGADLKNYSSLGSYIGMENFNYAISLGAKIFDAGLGDCGWKKLWHLDKIPQYSYHFIGGQIRYQID